jgi:hypothetical protein
MDVQEMVRVGLAGRRQAQHTGGRFAFDHDRLRKLGATEAQISQAEYFLARYAALDAEVASLGLKR